MPRVKISSLPGKFLEGLLQKTQSANMLLIRIPDSTSFGGKVFRQKSPCDFVGHVRGIPFMLEAKETEKDSIPRSKLLRDVSVHQFDAMAAWLDSHPSTRAGYLCHLGASTLVVYMPLSALHHIDSVNPKVVGLHGIRAFDLTTGRVDWEDLFLGGQTNGDTKS